MRKIGFAVVMLGLLAVPSAAWTSQGHGADQRNAARECRAERSAMGADAFAETYRNFGACVRTKARENAAERRSARRAAVRECRSQDLHGRELSACIRRAERAERAEDRAEQRAELNAARQCRAEREAMGEDAFREQYGTNRNKRNAFGKCVESKVSQDDQTGEQEPTQDGQGEQQGQSGQPDDAGRPDNAGPPQDA